MILRFSLFLLFLLGISACANKNKSNDASEEQAAVEEVSDELLEEQNLESDLVLDDTDEELILDDVKETESAEPLLADSGKDDALLMDNEITENAVSNTSKSVSINSGQIKSYVVQRNDTLMLIAWKIYGDYTKWRSLVGLNQGKLGSNYSISEGTEISYYAPSEEFNWNPEGNPYLIMRGDTLGLISNKVYGTQTKWKSIWNNNRPLIKDPNLIFAGFTLYYLTDGDVAMK